VIETATFVCSICGDSSTHICIHCTKDTCVNHRCIRCRRCSDCCECEEPLTAAEATEEPVVAAAESIPPAEPALAVESVPPSGLAPPPEPEPQVESPPPVAPEPPREPTQEELVKSLPELFAPDPHPEPEENR
jgi:hypothetical protein